MLSVTFNTHLMIVMEARAASHSVHLMFALLVTVTRSMSSWWPPLDQMFLVQSTSDARRVKRNPFSNVYFVLIGEHLEVGWVAQYYVIIT